MDVIRSCYSSTMYPYVDRPDVGIPGAWHFCRPGSRFLPFPTAFCSRNYLDKNDDYPAIGEVPTRPSWSAGKPLTWARGHHFCGSADVWQNGQLYSAPPLPVDRNGIPLCCDWDGPCLTTESYSPILTEDLAGCIQLEQIPEPS